MSLINDALKRTKEAQQQNPPPAGGPPLKPVDPAVTKSAGNSKSLLYIMVACVVVGNAFLFIYLKDGGKKPAVIPSSTPAPAVVAPATAPVAPPPAATTTPTTKLEPAPRLAANPAPAAPTAVTETTLPAATPAIAAQPEPPKPAPLKLQSIIYNPSRPSAMISGKFVLVGDKVQGFRVTAIVQETVTLVGNGQTNVLSLP